jgi:hypothetical protein
MALLIGPVVALLGVVMVMVVIRTKARAKRSLYASLRSDRERKVREIRERTLAPKSRAAAEPAAANADKAAAPSSVASIPPPPQQTRAAWDVSPLAPSHSAPAPAAPAPPPVPPPAAPITKEPARPAFDIAASAAPPAPPPAPPVQPVAPVTPQPAEPAWQSAPPLPTSAGPAQPVTAQPGKPAWDVVSSGKEIAHPGAHPAEPSAAAPRAAWEVVGGVPEALDTKAKGKRKGKAKPIPEDELDAKESPMHMFLSYAGLVAALLVVLLGVILMVGSSR